MGKAIYFEDRELELLELLVRVAVKRHADDTKELVDQWDFGATVEWGVASAAREIDGLLASILDQLPAKHSET